MQTKQVIQNSAQVIRITSITAGDVYKRFDETYDDRVYYGLVTAVHNDGHNTIIEATEYHQNWSSLEVAFKVLRGEKEYILFPSSPEELNLELDQARQSQLKKITDAEETIAKSKKLIAEIDSMISGERQKSLKAMSYKEMTQEQFKEKLEQLN